MSVREINVSSEKAFDHHEKVVRCEDPESGLLAFIAVHNTNLGPALGGCRMWPYADEKAAITDVLRLSKGMTYKSALAGLPLGGGKAVIVGDPRKEKTPALMRAMGECIEQLDGLYITAEDSGTSVADLKLIAERTQHVAGIRNKNRSGCTQSDGDPSPITALGVFAGIRASVGHRFASDDLSGVRVAVQGVGNVGGRLVRLLHEAGAEVLVSDINRDAAHRLEDELDGLRVLENSRLPSVEAEVFAPCALGGVLDSTTIAGLKVQIVAGAANNQLASAEMGDLLHQRGILYAPDYVINAGGIIDVYYERVGYDYDTVVDHVTLIGQQLLRIYRAAQASDLSTHRIADRLAESIFQQTQEQVVGYT